MNAVDAVQQTTNIQLVVKYYPLFTKSKQIFCKFTWHKFIHSLKPKKHGINSTS